MNPLSNSRLARIFLAFAFAYFLSALVRAITATLSPILTQELQLQASDLGLLSGAYFLGFAATQLPLGNWLDRHGPKTVILYFLSAAVLGCAAFALAGSFTGLLAARLLTGAGVSACLMAPLTGYRRWFSAATQMRTNSWMLMTGSLGMLASTLPVQWLLPLYGWRFLFWGLAVLIALSMLLIFIEVPAWDKAPEATDPQAPPAPPAPPARLLDAYVQVWHNPYFRRLAPMGFFSYGGMVAMQTLWAGPWMVKVCGYNALQAATGLFWINVTMLLTFWTWGMLSPWLVRRGLHANTLMTWGLPSSLAALALVILVGPDAGAAAPLLWSLFFVGSSFGSLSQPALALAFPSNLAGRALSAFNLAIFAGVFAVQWGVGLAIDAFKYMGLSEVQSFQAALGLFLLSCAWAYLHFCLGAREPSLAMDKAP